MKIFCFSVALLIFASQIGCASHSVDEQEVRLTTSDEVSFCQLLDRSREFDNREVLTTAILLTQFETAVLYDASCINEEKLVWYEIKDESEQERFSTNLTSEYESRGTFRAKVKISGTFHVKKARGFGHLNSFEYLFSISKVISVSAVKEDVPYPW